MRKQDKQREQEEKARRKLAKAQAEFQLAQEKRTAAIAKGERDVERARARAARQLTRATKRVERRAGAVARAEARLLALQIRPATQRERPAISTGYLGPQTAASDSSAASPDPVDALQNVEGERAGDAPLIVPDGASERLPDDLARPDGDSSTHP